MRYSLLSRFQAVLLGMTLGEELGIYSQICRSSLAASNLGPPSGLNLLAWQPQRSGSPSPAKARMAQMTEWLIQSGGRAIQSSLPAATANSKSEGLTAALPIALFFHDDEIKLRQALVKTVSPENLAGAMAISTAIAIALREKLQPMDLIPQTIAVLEQWLEATPSLTDLLNPLEQVQVGLGQHVSLHTIAARLQPSLLPIHRTIAIAFYCFLSTPEDFQLSVLRAVQVANAPGAGASAGALTGAISGAHNSTIGIPLAWRRLGSVRAIESEKSPEPEFAQLASRLWAVWSGALEPEISRLELEAIAAPNVIRSR